MGTMGSDGIVEPSPLLDEYRCLGQCVEDLSVQELVPQLAVEALVVAVLPRASRLDVECLHAEPGQPPPNELGRDTTYGLKVLPQHIRRVLARSSSYCELGRWRVACSLECC